MSHVVIKSDEQAKAEADVDGFRQDLGPFVVAAETTRMAMVFTDAKVAGHPIIFVNDAYLALTGYERAEVLGQGFNFLVARGSDPGTLLRLEAAFESGVDAELEIQDRCKDGTKFWAEVFITPVRDSSGEVVQHFGSLVDITRHRQEEDRLRYLLDELNHRTQNTLATVQAIAVQTLRGGADKQAIDTFEGRILALAKGHALLGRDNWEAVRFGDVVEQILRPFGLHYPGSTRIAVEGCDVRLQPKAALTIAMVLHELATNAARHGALSGTDGRVELTWHVEPSPQGGVMQLRWEESGGPAVTQPLRGGFGSRLIKNGLARDLGGEVRLTYEPAGAICQIAMPLRSGGSRACLAA
jgi:PAS domain S-box-containing protein